MKNRFENSGRIAIFQRLYHLPYRITQRLQIIRTDMENLLGIDIEVLVREDVTYPFDARPAFPEATLHHT